MSEASTKPYPIQAIYKQCTDNGLTPYVAVFADNNTNVPREFVKNGKIVLNVSFDATSQLDMDNGWITFHARFSGMSHEVEVPIENVLAAYARENGQGMVFPVERSTPTTRAAIGRENNSPPKLTAVDSESVFASVPAGVETGPEDGPTPPNVPRISGRPALRVVK